MEVTGFAERFESGHANIPLSRRSRLSPDASFSNLLVMDKHNLALLNPNNLALPFINLKHLD